jgi:hypothetical protein
VANPVRTDDEASSTGGAGPLALVIATVLVGAFTVVGADTYWAVALGDIVLDARSVPAGVPFLVTAVADWPNPLVAGEALLAMVDRVPVGLPLLQIVIVTAVLVGVAQGAVALSRSAAWPVVLTLVGAAASLVVVRLPSLSLVPFVLLAALLREEHDRPSWRVWLAVPLVAVWSNLHGGFIVGLGLLLAYLGFSRLLERPVSAVFVGLAALIASTANPAGLRTLAYVVRVFGNEAARRGTDLWARPDPSSPLDLAMVLVVVVLLVRAVRSKVPWWEAAAAAGLVVATAMTARNGTWLVLLLAPWAGRRLSGGRAPSRSTWAAAAVAAALLGAVTVSFRGAATAPAGHDLAQPLVEFAAGRPILAGEPVAESVAAAGGRVWGSNPIDAMTPEAQRDFLDFLHEGRLPAELPPEIIVVVSRGGALERGLASDARWSRLREIGSLAVYERAL